MFEDEYSGIGGNYVIDPVTGKRMPEAEYFAQLAAQAEPAAPSRRRSSTPSTSTADDTSAAAPQE